MGEMYMGFDEITVNRTVFSPEKLEAFIEDANSKFNTNDRFPNIEPLRHCEFGSRMIVKNLKSDEEWGFGYESSGNLYPDNFREAAYFFDVSVHRVEEDFAGNKIDTVEPAQMSLQLFDTWLTRAGCSIERAALFKKPVRLNLDCIKAVSGVCFFSYRRSNIGDHLCFATPGSQPIECRYMPDKTYDIVSVDWGYDVSESKQMVFYPLRSAASQNSCKDIEQSNLIAGESDTVAAVLGCLV